MLVTYEKLINDSRSHNSFLIKIEKGVSRKDAVQVRFLTIFENVKEFSERYTIFYKFQSAGKGYKELKSEYLTFPEEH